MKLRPMQLNDIPAGLHLCRLSGWNQQAEDWRFFLESAGGYVAERNGCIVGTVTFLRYGRLAWLSMMLVHPDARRSGVGASLMEAALQALADEPCIRLDATPVGEPLYRRFGFTGELGLARAKVTVDHRLLPPPSPDARPMQSGDLAAVFAHDLQVFGADRSALLASLYNRAPGLAWILHRGGTLLGYCFGRPGARYWQLGPVIAEDAEVARDLTIACLSCLHEQDVAIDIPRDPSPWSAWLLSAGFTIERPFLRMRRGETDSPGIPERCFAIAGPEFG